MPISDLAKASLHKKVMKLMGNRFALRLVAPDESWANTCIQEAVEEIRRIEKLLTTFDDSSQTSLINKNAGIGSVKVDVEMFELIQRSKKNISNYPGFF